MARQSYAEQAKQAFGNQDKTAIVEVKYPDANGKGHTYSYVGTGTERVGRHFKNAPITDKWGNDRTAPATVVATHKVAGVNVGDHTGVTGNTVHSIPKPLKFIGGKG